jgi:hypothetical protein
VLGTRSCAIRQVVKILPRRWYVRLSKEVEDENDDEDENDWGSRGSKQKKPHACCSNVNPID